MTTDVQQQANSRLLFKMNCDFWQQMRGPPEGEIQGPNLINETDATPPDLTTNSNNPSTSVVPGNPSVGNSAINVGNIGNGNGNCVGSTGRSATSPVPNVSNTSSVPESSRGSNSAVDRVSGSAGNIIPKTEGNKHGNDAGYIPGGNGTVLSPTALHHQLQQIHQQQQQHYRQHPNNPSTSSAGMNTPIPNVHMTPNQLTAGNCPVNLLTQQQLQQSRQQSHQQQPLGQPLSDSGMPSQVLTPGGSSTPDVKFNNEKLVNEIQLQLSRSNSAAAISERTLEECWSTLQRLFMHKSAMQQIQHMPRVGLGAGISAEVKPHQCQQCLKSFSSNHQLVQHIRVHTGEKPYKCSYCDRRFKQLSHVQQHTRLHTGERPYKCHLPNCGRAFIQLSNLQQHLRNHDAQVERAKNRPFHCNICGKGFATESSLRTHTSKVSHELQLHLGVLQQHAALIGGPNATTCPVCHKLFLGGEALMEHMKHAHKDPNASGVATKRRTANHPCPVCGKHYVNEGSLRKHLACHPETSQLTSSLRMWPCSVCQAVFTHEAGLLTHMEHMRMEPKHQFAAQYVLSRAAAERRERDTLLAAAVAVSASSSGLLSMSGSAVGPGDGGPNSMCASPSAHSDSSSGNGRLSSTGSDPDGNHMNNNNNNCNSKLSDILRASNNGHLHQQYGVDDLPSNRMSLMAAAAGIVGQTAGSVPGSLGSPGVGVDSTTAGAVQAAVVNLAAAMRMGHVASQQNVNNGPNGGVPSSSPSSNNDSASAAAAQAAMNAMRVSMADSMMRSSMVVDPISHQSHQHHQPSSPEAALRMHQAEAILRSQAEAAIRLAVSVAASNNGAGSEVNVNNTLRHQNGAFGQQQSQQAQQQQQSSGSDNSGNSRLGGGNGTCSQPPQHPPQSQTPQLYQQQQQQQQQQVNSDISEAIRLQEHRLEQALRLHNDARALNFLASSNGDNASQPSQHQSHNP